MQACLLTIWNAKSQICSSAILVMESEKSEIEQTLVVFF